MRYALSSTALLAGTSIAASVRPAIRNAAADAMHLVSRALPDAPDGYTPATVDCPSTRPSVRSASSLSDSESSWLDTRRGVTIPAMRDFVASLNISGFDAQSYFQDNADDTTNLPNVGLAFSGGGYRALLTGAGALRSFDSREADSSVASGGLGGLLQSATYVAGLSGGSWLVGSVYVNNFSTVSDLQGSSDVWRFENTIFQGPDAGGIQLLDSASYFDTIRNEVQGKDDAGFNTTITDYWGRALSFQLVNARNGGDSYTWSSIRDQPGFSAAEYPYPLVVADGRNPGSQIISLNSSVYEFSPYEFGTWDPTTFGFVDTRFLGSAFEGGELPQGASCVRGFDNAGFVMGTSSSLFNQFLLNIPSDSGVPGFITDAVEGILGAIGESEEDIAAYRPNPFRGFDVTGQSRNANEAQLTLVDGGSDLQNIPLHPLIQPVRNVDVIFAVDSSADVNNWPNGTSLVATYERSLSDIANGTAFPSIPDQNTFVNLGLNNRPTFFGCDADNTSSPAPLVVYIPNSPYVFFSNISTFEPQYDTDVRDAIVENGDMVATMGNATVDDTWPTCVGCALMSRSWDRTGADVPEACTQCFQRFCWNGTLASGPAPNYLPELRLQEIDTQDNAAGALMGNNRVLLAAAAAVVGWIVL